MNTTSPNTHQGSCFCGSVTFEVTGAPDMMGYCHCADCASWAGAPINDDLPKFDGMPG